jgi:hypothetical protein
MWKKCTICQCEFFYRYVFLPILPSRFRERIIISFLSVAFLLLLQASVLLATHNCTVFSRQCDLADFYDPKKRKKKKLFRTKIVFIFSVFKLKLVLSDWMTHLVVVDNILSVSWRTGIVFKHKRVFYQNCGLRFEIKSDILKKK